MVTCKVCHLQFACIADHVAHYDLCHRVTLKSQFTCGYLECAVRVVNLDRYHYHVKQFHAESNSSFSHVKCDSSANLSGNPDVDTFAFKCVYPSCNYKCQSKSTLRSHSFWTHPRNSQSTEVSICNDQDENVGAVGATAVIEDESLAQNENVTLLGSVLSSSQVEGQHCVVLNDNCMYDAILKKFVHLGLTLTSKQHMPDSTLAFVINSYSTLLKEASNITVSKLEEEFAAHGVSPDVTKPIVKRVLSENVLTKLHASSDGPMRSYYMRQQQYKKHFPHLPPKQIRLGLNGNNILCKYHYVPIAESIKWLFEDDSVHQQYLETKKRQVLSPYLTDFHSGTSFQNHPLFSHDVDALQIILYHDDVDIANCIGPAGGTFKMMHMSYTLANLHPWSRSKVDPLQLIMLCKETDVAYFGFPTVLEPLIKDLKHLEETGVEIRGQIVKASVLVLLGDNLGTHSIGGFTEGFSKSKYFCRYCEESRDEWITRFYGKQSAIRSKDIVSSSDESSDDSHESGDDLEKDAESHESASNTNVHEESDSDDNTPLDEIISLSDLRKQLRKNNAPLRTVSSYNKCVKGLENNPHGVKGIVADSEFNKLKYFHVVGGTPPCLPHDIFEGIAPYDLMLCVKKVCKTYKFSLAYLNRKIISFPFQGEEGLDKPPAKFSAIRKKVKGSAVQNHVFLRFLPMLIGEKVTDKRDPVWLMILYLIEIVVLITSPIVSKSVLNHVDDLIHKYLQLRTTLFKEVPIRPKHHYFEHLRLLTLMYGPIMKSSTMRFESKHKFFKSELRAKKCLKNPTKSLSNAHQYMQSSLRIDNLFNNAPSMTADAVPLEEFEVQNEIMQCILSSFGTDFASQLLYSKKVIFHSTTYESGKVIVTSTSKHPQIELCKINVLALDGNTAYAVGMKCEGTLHHDMQFYWLVETTECLIVPLHTLRDFVPYSVYTWCQKPVIVLKHLFLEK